MNIHTPKGTYTKYRSNEFTITKNVNNMKRYFNFEDLKTFHLGHDLTLEPYNGKTIDLDVKCLTMLAGDEATIKYMSGFDGYGDEADTRRKMYLENTCMTTMMGIAFAYAIRLEKYLIGLIKMTSPTHNEVTNNFPHWLLDFIIVPTMRNKKIMKASLDLIIYYVFRTINIKELFAMVDPDNNESIHILKVLGFNVIGNTGIAPNPATGNIPLLFVLKNDRKRTLRFCSSK